MNIVIENEISNEWKEQYTFTQFDLTWVLTEYAKFEYKNRKWQRVSWRSVYYERDATLKYLPLIPVGVRVKLRDRINELIQIKTWIEFKK